MVAAERLCDDERPHAGGHPAASRPELYLQGVATLDPARDQMRLLFGGKSGDATIALTHVPASFGDTVRVRVREIDWTGQLGDSARRW